jgi:alanyl-tRNA synthetase
MGLERMAAVLQGVHSNYDTDLFRGLIRASAEAIGVDAEGPRRPSHRVIADHLRASAFLVADGVLPSNEGRGYVLRRIMRRAMRHAELLGAKDPVMFKLVPALVREMGSAYPELTQSEALISETLKLEETRFRKTLAKGLTILDEESSKLKKGDTLSGDVAFKLHDTYGFPLDLTQDALRGREILVDTAAFETAMEKQRADARASWSGSGDAATETVWFAVRDKAGATEFLGYDTETAEGVVTALVKDGKEVAALETGDSGFVVLNQTPFYAESGGQQGDRGEMVGGGVALTVTDTQKRADGVFVHAVTVNKGEVAPGAALELKVDHARRSAIRANHSATHLLHEALRRVLGDHVAQKGSLVAPDRLRFDFSHTKPISPDELAEIEAIANRLVLQNEPVITKLMAVDDAVASGARALFGEKYGDEVRVVSMGSDREGGASQKAFSVELCGGTHVTRTGDIGLVAITGESGVAGGVRRLEAATGEGARRLLREESRALDEITSLLKTPLAEAPARLAALLDERKKLERELTDARKKLALGGGGGEGASGDEVKDVGGVKFLGRVLKGIPAKDLKSMVDDAKKKLGSGVISFIAIDDENRASIVVGVTEDKVATNSAVDLVRVAAEALGGKGGGGRPDMAQAGGPDGSKADAALAAVEKQLRA